MDALLLAHDEADISGSTRPKYIWLEHTAARLAEGLRAAVGDEDSTGWRLWYRLQAVGLSLHSYHWQTPKQTDELVAIISPDYRPRLQFNSSGHLFAGLPNTFEYFEHRVLYANAEKQAAGSLENNWRSLDSIIKSDPVLRREYAILINRHASYIRADWHLNSFDRGVKLEKSLRRALNIYSNLRRGLSAAACLSALALVWIGSQSGDGFLASILAVLLLGFCYVIITRLYDREQAWWDRAMTDLTPFVRLEKALHAAEDNVDLERCRTLATRLFEKGFVEMRYVLCVLTLS